MGARTQFHQMDGNLDTGQAQNQNRNCIVNNCKNGQCKILSVKKMALRQMLGWKNPIEKNYRMEMGKLAS